jgi:hypothetical protein
MKEETTKKLVKSIGSLQESISTLTVDEINKKAPDAEPEIQEMSLKERAKLENVRYIEPKRRLSPPLGTLPEKLKAEHKHAWEYVKGMYENYVINGEPITFSYCQYPGDADYMWEIPSNTPVYVPRMIAKHLEEIQKYHQFEYREKTNNSWRPDDFTHQFNVTATHYRGKFRALGAFA